jgi:hypothetical protein
VNKDKETPVNFFRFSKHVATVAFVLTIFCSFAFAGLQIGSSNTATADPTLPHPKTTPCKVVLFQDYKFDNFTPQSFNYTPPACAAPWAKVILVANFSVTKGIQYDRTANIWIGPTNIYFGTTSEPDPSNARNWQIQRDLTDYSSIFTAAQTGTVYLFNLYNRTYNGLLHGSATVYFYPLPANTAAPVVPDQVIGFSGGSSGGTVALDTTGSCCQPALSETLTLPTNIRSVFLDVYAQSQNDDEFWYTCVPTAVAGELESCGNTAFRETEITIDGTPAGVAPVYPWIFTGGIDPLLWIPIPGVQTLKFVPYRVNLTPFASLLDNGQPHTISLSVFNADDYFSATASLLLYLDLSVAQLTGGVTENTLAAPTPNYAENIQVAPNGNVHGTVKTTSTHNFKISGYINTAKGPVTTTVAQDINFGNLQNFKITNTTYQQNIKQNDTIHSTVTTVNGTGKHVNQVDYFWPVTVDIGLVFESDGNIDQTTSINQYYEVDQEATLNGQAQSFSVIKNRVTPTDLLELNSSFEIIGNENQSSAQSFFESNSTGYCYSRSITAAASVLTSITNGVGCN